MVNIKVVHKDSLRRFTLPSNANWIELEAKLRSLFAIPALTPFTLSYTDEDNDVITLSTDIELREILSASPTIKFNLKFSTPDDSSDSEESNNEVWVFEGRNIPPHISNSDRSNTTDSGLQDNVTQSNVTSTTYKEPQYIDIDSDDTVLKRIPMSFSDDEFESVNSLSKKTSQLSLLDEDYERVKPLDKKTTPLEEDEVGKSLKTSPFSFEPLGLGIRTTSLLDEDYEVEKSLGKKNSLLDEDYDVGKSLDKTTSLSDEDYDVGKFSNISNMKKTYLNEDYEQAKSSKKTSLFGEDYDEEKSLGKKTSLLNEDYDLGKPLDKKTSLLDDDLFDPFKFKPNIGKPKPKRQRGKQIQKETIGASPPNNASSFASFSDQSRRRRRQEPNIQTPPVVDLAEQFDKMIERDTFGTSPIPIPGSFPTRPKPSTPVIWAGRTPPDFNTRGRGGRGARARGSRGNRGGRGKNRNQNQNQNQNHHHHHHHHHHNEFLEQKEGTSGGEELELSEGEEEVPELQDDLTDLQILYPEQIKTLKSMGYKEEAYVELLIKHDGDIEQVVEALLNT